MRKQIFILMIGLILMTAQGAAMAAVGPNWIEQFGITWTFDKDISTDGAGDTYQYGTFANGDYWVVGPVNIININPPSTEVDGRIMNGSMINPSTTTTNQGYDSAMQDNDYDPDLNVAFNVDAGNPLTVAIDSSLISAISHPTAANRPQLKTAAILTVLSSAPAANSFRPPYCGADKSIRFNVSDLDYSKLASLPALGSVLTLHKDTLVNPSDQDETVERMFERPWIDHMPNWTARELHPLENMPDYGSTMAVQIGQGALMLHLDFSNAQKETLFIRFVQLGLDLYGIIQNGGKDNWAASGGHTRGRKMPILFASLVLNDSGMQAMFAKTGDYLYEGEYGHGNPPSDLIHFSEDDQTFYVDDEDIFSSPYDLNVNAAGQKNGTVDVVNGSAIVIGHGTNWISQSTTRYFGVVGGAEAIAGVGGYDYRVASWDSPTQVTLATPYAGNTSNSVSYRITDRLWFGHGHMGNLKDYREYTSEHLGMPESGYAHAINILGDGLDWDATYRSGREIAGNVLTVLIMDAKSLWNHNAWFDYEDRYVSIQTGINPAEVFWTKFTRDMWDAYRADYGPVWPDTGSALYGDVNADGEISAYDAALALQASVVLITLTPEQTQAADVSGDGEVNAYDAALIAQRVVWIITKFPVEP
jgi:hypothetical protein